MDKETKATIKDLYSKFDAVKPGESIFYFGSRLNFACDINDVREVKRLLADPAYDPHSRGANGNNCLRN